VSGTLRVLPLGGVGEIGKNMTVVEYDGRIVVVDCGLRFPTAEMMGIDLVPKSENAMRRYRWREISVVFQGAMNALNPVRRVRDQIQARLRQWLENLEEPAL